MIAFYEEPIDVERFLRLRNFVFLPVVDSTNAVGRAWIDYASAEEVDVVPVAICALEQTSGRGRRQRTWRSPRGGLYATFVWELPPETVLAHLPLAASLWAAEACSRAFGLSARIKWPNDLLLGGRKLGGILTEVKTRGEQSHAVVGIGINVVESEKTEGEDAATSAEREAGHKPSVGKAFLELCGQFDAFLGESGTSGIVEAWRGRTVHQPGDRMTVSFDEDGTESSVEGAFDGVTDEGFLRLKTESGDRVLTSGEVRTW